ncbi:MAG: DUF5686 and carboxypeptidase regulatory-like domain-containing protein, partial [Flavobacteriales bacterium]
MKAKNNMINGSKHYLFKISFTLFLFIFPLFSIAQLTIEGKVIDKDHNPLPFVNVYIKGTTHGTTTNSKGEFSLKIKEKNKNKKIVFTYIGYEKKIKRINIEKELTVTLKKEDVKLEEVKVKSGKDPAYRIIEKTKEKREYHLNQVKAYSGKVYMKGTAYLNSYPDWAEGNMNLNNTAILDDSTDSDSSKSNLVYLTESLTKFHYKKPDHYKEEMISSKVSGSLYGFSSNRTLGLLFNFYKNKLNTGVSERKFISPIASSSALYYDYKLMGTFEDEGEVINKIKVIPKRKHDPIFHGEIYIVDGKWKIHSVNLYITGDSPVQMIDTAKYKQSYVPVKDSIWMPLSLEIKYHFNTMGFDIIYEQVGVFSDYQINKNFQKGFFDNEVFKIKKGARKQDSTYWNKKRSVKLTEDEKENYEKGDSLAKLKTSKEYLDSIDKKNNKFKPFNFILSGYSYDKSYDSVKYSLESLLSSIKFNAIEGWVLNLTPKYKNYKDPDKTISIDTDIRYGFASNKLFGKINTQYTYDRKHFGRFYLKGGKYPYQYNHSNPIYPFYNSIYALSVKKDPIKLYDRTFLK